jgi:hypothetical protein
VVVLLLAALLATALSRHFAVGKRRTLVTKVAGGDSQSLSRMSSFSLALLLGGLRGPLAMILWTSSEAQKSEKNLEDIDTKIELIRMLQAEFDSVHLFQIWNKGYNLSVQMANLPNKYATILDAIEYGRAAERERRDNINLLFAIGDLMFSKLGEAQEKNYYRTRVRDETLPPEPTVKIIFPSSRRAELLRAARRVGLDSLRVPIRNEAQPGVISTTVRKTYADRLAPLFSGPDVRFETREPRPASAGNDGSLQQRRFPTVLGEDFRVLPALLEPRNPRPADLPADQRFNDGAELQYVADFHNDDGSLWTFPYGMSPYALAYSYFKRAEFQQTIGAQRHLQLGSKVISARPALSLYKWTEEEWQRGRRLEIEFLLDTEAPVGDEIDRERITAGIPPSTTLQRTPLADEALFSYDRAVQITRLAKTAYLAHLRRFVEEEPTYRSHFDWMDGLGALNQADATYLRVLLAEGDEKRSLARRARDEYEQAVGALIVSVLRYYVTDEAIVEIFPKGKNDPMRKHEIVGQLSIPERRETLTKLNDRLQQEQFALEQRDEIVEFSHYISRADQRMKMLDAFLASPATTPATGNVP